MAKVKVLAELVEHHVKEEEKETLKHVRKEFDLETQMAQEQNMLKLKVFIDDVNGKVGIPILLHRGA
jgi:hypothetical protein